MRDAREEWYDAKAKIKATIVDVTDAAQRLAASHLCGPTSAYFLTEALAAVALLGEEAHEPDETVILQMTCSGPLGGLTVECTSAGTLRGYTNVKILEDFDGLGRPDARKVLGARQIQVTRSVPGRILAQGVATTLGGYLTQSLQRQAEIRVEAAVSDEVEILEARGLLVEALPDAGLPPSAQLMPRSLSLNVSSRNLLKKLSLEHAELKSTVPLSFACRCSAERAAAMLAALGDDERKSLPPRVDVTCHMCGKTWTVETRGAETTKEG